MALLPQLGSRQLEVDLTKVLQRAHTGGVEAVISVCFDCEKQKKLIEGPPLSSEVGIDLVSHLASPIPKIVTNDFINDLTPPS